MSAEYAAFSTSIGECAIVWTVSGIKSVFLPHRFPGKLEAQILQKFPQAHSASAPPAIARTISDIIDLLKGKLCDLKSAELDWQSIPEFHRRVYEVARSIPPGRVMTYGEISAALNAPGSARAVGQALGANPFPIIIPCHRVLAADGKSGGFSAPGGLSTKMKILNIERAKLSDAPSLFENLPLAVNRRASTQMSKANSND